MNEIIKRSAQNTPLDDHITRIYLIRHGESVGNLNKICLGHTDLDLTERGKEQAKMTADALKGVNAAAVYSSDLIRAVHTAEPHAGLRRLDIRRSPGLRELYFGDWENRAVSYLTDTYGDMFTVGWRGNFGTFTPPNGESVQDMAERMYAEMLKIGREWTGENIIVVSHAAAIRALWGKISGLEPENVAVSVSFPSNASFSILEYRRDDDGEHLIPIEYSSDTHLAGISTALLG